MLWSPKNQEKNQHWLILNFTIKIKINPKKQVFLKISRTVWVKGLKIEVNYFYSIPNRSPECESKKPRGQISRINPAIPFVTPAWGYTETEQSIPPHTNLLTLLHRCNSINKKSVCGKYIYLNEYGEYFKDAMLSLTRY